MRVVILWLKWLLVPKGIVVVEERGRIGWFEVLKYVLRGVWSRSPGGPTAEEFATWFRLRRPLKRYACRICGVRFWAWRRRDICYKWSCYRASCV